MNKKLKRQLIKIIISLGLFTVSWLPWSEYLRLSILAAAYLIVGMPIIGKALRNIRQGQIFDENFLMMIATFGAIVLGEYAEAVAVMLFFQLGEFFQTYAVNRSRKSIAELMNIRPDFARVLRHGQTEVVNPEDVQIGEIIEVRPGEKIPLDGMVTKGTSALDMAALTGESVPVEVNCDSEVLSGSINLNGVLEIKTSQNFGESTVVKILSLVENASSQKANIENFITKFARWYTPLVVVVALILAVVPPLILPDASWRNWGYRAITFLVISCPCALVISVPLSFFGGIGAASKCGILVKGANYLEALARVETVVFDKTGTLTKGKFAVQKICPQDISPDKLLEIAAYIEAYSSHPIALSIKQAFGKSINSARLDNVHEIFGCGISAEIDGIEAAVGNDKILEKYQLKPVDISEAATVIHVVYDGRYIGYILIGDELKPDAARAVAGLQALGINQIVVLTGDKKTIAQNIASKLQINQVFAELLPAQKVAKLEDLLAQKSAQKQVMFIGDGINDAPVLARADIGVAMGGIGADAAIEAADVVIMTDEPSKLGTAIKIARRTLLIANENIVFAIGVKLIVLGLGAIGYASIWAAVFADVGVSVLAIVNAMRTLWLHKSSQC